MAVFPVAAGHPDLSGNYIPTLYAAKLVVEFYITTVLNAITNTDYEGMIKNYGDKVTIRGLPTIDGFPYVKGMDIPYGKPVPPAVVELLIDQGWGWSFPINIVDVKQSDIDFVSKWAIHASETASIHIDNDVLANIYGSAHPSNAGATAGAKSASFNLGVAGTPLAITKVNIPDVIVDCMTVLDEQSCPQQGRWIVLPAWACGLIKKSDLKDASLTGDGTSIMRNGRIGMIDRAEVFMSNNLTTNASGGHTATEAIFGTKLATTFATQITEKEIVPNPKDYGQLMRMLQVYGYKVVKPEALGHLHVYKG